jgi:hypothetical protein
VPKPAPKVEPRHVGAGGAIIAALAAAWHAFNSAAPWPVVAGLVVFGVFVAAHVLSSRKA